MDIFSKLKRMVQEPKIYALTVDSDRGQTLYLGAHFSLEDAFAAARERMEMIIPHGPEETLSIDLWNTLSARQAIAQLMDPAWANELVPTQEKRDLSPEERSRAAAVANGDLPSSMAALLTSFSTNKAGEEKKITLTINDHILSVKETKNLLMKKLIDSESISQAEKLKSLLGPNSLKYVLKEIQKKKGII